MTRFFAILILLTLVRAAGTAQGAGFERVESNGVLDVADFVNVPR